METLDSPVPLTFNNGNSVPMNARMIAFVFLIIGLSLSFTGYYFIGLPLILLFLVITFNQHRVVIHPGEGLIHDYTSILGFIKYGKKYALKEYKYITGMPLVQSTQIYSRSNSSTVITNNYTTVTLFKNGLRGKRTLTQFDSKSEADELANKLAHHLDLTFFEYDPQLVRAILRGEKTL